MGSKFFSPFALTLILQQVQIVGVLAAAQSLIILEEHTGKSFGYRIDDPPDERAAAVARWRAWAASVGGVPR